MKSYISRKLPLETRITVRTLSRRSVADSIARPHITTRRLERKSHERRGAKNSVHELAVGNRDEQREHERQVNYEQDAHHGLPTHHEKEQSRQTRQEQQRDEGGVQSSLRGVVERLVAALLQGEQAGRTDEQPEAADGAENDRQARIPVRGGPAEPGVVDGSHGR